MSTLCSPVKGKDGPQAEEVSVRRGAEGRQSDGGHRRREGVDGKETALYLSVRSR